MRYLTSVMITLFLFLSAKCQQAYVCRYTDSLGVTSTPAQMDSIRRMLGEKGLPPDFIEGYINRTLALPDFFNQVQERIVSSRNDSSFITLNYKAPENSVQFRMPGNKLLVVGGKLFRFDVREDSYLPSRIPDSSQVFRPTSRKKKIIDFMCDEYESADGIYRIWVTKSLPSSINPGIAVNNVKGAILFFEARHGNSFTKSLLSSIEVVKKVI